MTDPDGGRTTYGYDAKGRETWQKNPLSQRTTFVYDAADRTTELYVANGARTSYVYDAGSRPTALTNLTSAGTIISSFTYTYDNVGDRTNVAEADGARTTWTYDNTYRLTNEHRWDVLGWESLTVDQWDAMSVDDWDKMEVSGAGAIFNTTYTYDPVGNRLLMEDSAAPTTYTYNAANELLTAENSPGVTTYTYDGDGNRLTKDHPADGVSTYGWDTQNRLLSAHDPVAGRFTFAYNADGQRVERETPDEQRKFVYDFTKPLLETTAGNLTTLTYDYSNRDRYGELIGRREHDDQTSFHQYDALGSTESLLDALEAVTGRYAYRAFGKIESQTGDTENRQTYIGKFGYFSEEDLGLYFLNARYYDLETGQFVSRDPIGYDGGVNLYEYVGNSPLQMNDPQGLQATPLCDKNVDFDCGSLKPRTRFLPGEITWLDMGCKSEQFSLDPPSGIPEEAIGWVECTAGAASPFRPRCRVPRVKIQPGEKGSPPTPIFPPPWTKLLEECGFTRCIMTEECHHIMQFERYAPNVCSCEAHGMVVKGPGGFCDWGLECFAGAEAYECVRELGTKLAKERLHWFKCRKAYIEMERSYRQKIRSIPLCGKIFENLLKTGTIDEPDAPGPPKK